MVGDAPYRIVCSTLIDYCGRVRAYRSPNGEPAHPVRGPAGRSYRAGFSHSAYRKLSERFTLLVITLCAMDDFCGYFASQYFRQDLVRWAQDPAGPSSPMAMRGLHYCSRVLSLLRRACIDRGQLGPTSCGHNAYHLHGRGPKPVEWKDTSTGARYIALGSTSLVVQHNIGRIISILHRYLAPMDHEA